MKVAELKEHLRSLNQIDFLLPNGDKVPSHFHLTEAGLVTKDFVDCGGQVRSEKNIHLQLWVAEDVNHRLEAHKLSQILSQFEKVFGPSEAELKIEYQQETLSLFGISFDGGKFLLTRQQTACLAEEHCGLPKKKQLQEFIAFEGSPGATCKPGGGCC